MANRRPKMCCGERPAMFKIYSKEAPTNIQCMICRKYLNHDSKKTAILMWNRGQGEIK